MMANETRYRLETYDYHGGDQKIWDSPRQYSWDVEPLGGLNLDDLEKMAMLAGHEKYKDKPVRVMSSEDGGHNWAIVPKTSLDQIRRGIISKMEKIAGNAAAAGMDAVLLPGKKPGDHSVLVLLQRGGRV